MKKVILTVDYELFFGKESGSVSECMIEPTERLLNLLENYKSKMTLFWDILHFYKLLELENSFPELKKERVSIETQIKKIIRMGHDVQLHIHPHWLDAKYENSNWIFSYDRFRLHNLSEEPSPDDINTILGCITISRKLMEQIIKEENHNYKVTVFRAGGYLKDPFHLLKDALLANGIKIDSSVSLGLFNDNGNFSYDYRDYKGFNKEDFSSRIIFNDDEIVEIPIASIELSFVRNFYYKLLRRKKYSKINNNLKGQGIRSTDKKINIYNKISRIFTNRWEQLTFDNNFPEKMDHMIENIPEFSTMIMHSKFFNQNIYRLLEENLSNKQIQFISIQDFID